MVDVATAEHHGVCPTCEGYGGAAGDCPNLACQGSCPSCWCPGCRDGYGVKWDEVNEEHPCGSWEAYVTTQGLSAGGREATP